MNLGVHAHWIGCSLFYGFVLMFISLCSKVRFVTLTGACHYNNFLIISLGVDICCLY